jgi:hypothetical protein
LAVQNLQILSHLLSLGYGKSIPSTTATLNNPAHTPGFTIHNTE